MEYHPQPRTAGILNWCLVKIRQVPYAVSLRWVFYRAVQEKGLLKDDYGKFKKWTSRARKRHWKGWDPTTVVDDTREMLPRGGGFDDVRAWVKSFEDRQPLLNKRYSQEVIVTVMYEAEAMTSQFKHYTDPYYVTLVPFKGDPSIHYKWLIAQHLNMLSDIHPEKNQVVLYFGDLDDKGLQIPKSALADIRMWTHADFQFRRVGLSKEQVEQWKIPDNPEKPGQYQWEALPDEAARQIILEALDELIDLDAIREIESLEVEAHEFWVKSLEGLDLSWVDGS